MTIAKRLAGAREAAGLSIDRLAMKANVSSSTVRNLETDPTRVPTPEMLFALADVLKVDPRWLGTSQSRQAGSDVRPVEAPETPAPEALPAADEPPPKTEHVSVLLSFPDRGSLERAVRSDLVPLTTLAGGTVVAVSAGHEATSAAINLAVEKELTRVRELILAFGSLTPQARADVLVKAERIAAEHPINLAH